MDAQSDFLASRYAQALYGYIPYPFEEETLFKLEALASFLQRYQTRLVGISKECLERILLLYAIEKLRFDLLLTLLEKRRILHLFGGVVKKYLELYKEKNNITVCTLRSSHNIIPEKREAIAFCMERITGNRLFYSFVHDRSLIAGIRIEGEAIMWEHSISRELRLIEQLQ